MNTDEHGFSSRAAAFSHQQSAIRCRLAMRMKRVPWWDRALIRLGDWVYAGLVWLAERGDCGFRIADCGSAEGERADFRSEIRDFRS